jgi:hypothetical protein
MPVSLRLHHNTRTAALHTCQPIRLRQLLVAHWLDERCTSMPPYSRSTVSRVLTTEQTMPIIFGRTLRSTKTSILWTSSRSTMRAITTPLCEIYGQLDCELVGRSSTE